MRDFCYYEKIGYFWEDIEMTELGHNPGCSYPHDPCNCKCDREREATHHEHWCNYPHDPCGCGMKRRAKKFREMEGREPRDP